MSTRTSMFYVEHKAITYHLWGDCFDDKTVYLGTGRNGNDRGTVIDIPIEVWDCLVRNNPMDRMRTIAKQTDAEIKAIVETDVDDRIAAHKRGARFASLSGFFTYGGAERPRKHQIADGIRYFHESRKRARAAVSRARRVARKAEE